MSGPGKNVAVLSGTVDQVRDTEKMIEQFVQQRTGLCIPFGLFFCSRIFSEANTPEKEMLMSVRTHFRL